MFHYATAAAVIDRVVHPAVVDFDLDGKLDLLVGDYPDIADARDDLSAAERDEFLDADRHWKAMMESDYDEMLAEKLAAVRKRLCKGERYASAVRLYRRITP